MKICLIRHGETDWNKIGRLQGREDLPLNRRGILQARQTARCLAGGTWHAVIASPLLRAKQTAQIIADTLGTGGVVTDDCFMERDYGKASGLTEAERNARYPDRQYEGMEDWEALRKRMVDGLSRYTKEYLGRNIVIVSHGSAINSVLSTLSGGAIGSGKTRLKDACLNMLRAEDLDFSIEYFNQTADELLRETPG